MHHPFIRNRFLSNYSYITVTIINTNYEYQHLQSNVAMSINRTKIVLTATDIVIIELFFKLLKISNISKESG